MVIETHSRFRLFVATLTILSGGCTTIYGVGDLAGPEGVPADASAAPSGSSAPPHELSPSSGDAGAPPPAARGGSQVDAGASDATGASPPEPVTHAPHSFSFYYGKDPKQRRDWVALTSTEWQETRSDGSTDRFVVIRRGKFDFSNGTEVPPHGNSGVASTDALEEGTFLKRDPDNGDSFFIADVNSPRMALLCKIPPDSWGLLGAMQDAK